MAAGCLILGSALYVLCRPTALLMFHWANSLGLADLVGAVRSVANGSDGYVPGWTIYSLPFALWVSSYLFFVNGVWAGSSSFWRRMWFWCIPVIAVATEVAQYLHAAPGVFDPIDLFTIILATLFGLALAGSAKPTGLTRL